MKAKKINIDRPGLSAQQINSRQQFERLLQDHNQAEGVSSQKSKNRFSGKALFLLIGTTGLLVISIVSYQLFYNGPQKNSRYFREYNIIKDTCLYFNQQVIAENQFVDSSGVPDKNNFNLQSQKNKNISIHNQKPEKTQRKEIEIILNGDFELYHKADSFPFLEPNNWIYVSTPDFYHANNKNYFKAAKTGMGIQLPHSKNGYMGLYVRRNVKEYIVTKINQRLEAGKKYRIEFYTVLSKTNKTPTWEIGALLSENIINENELYEQKPHVFYEGDAPFSETEEWQLIQREYIATGKEQYLYIGAFKRGDRKIYVPEYIPTIHPLQFTYTFIDDVKIYKLN